MKKITALALALLIILSALTLTACGGNKSGGEASNNTNKEASVYETVAKAIENTLNAKSYDADIDTLLKTDLMGSKSENSADVNIKAAALDTDKPKALAIGKRIMEGYTSDLNEYFDGEWRYFGNAEQGTYKTQCTFAEYAKEVGNPQSIVTALPEALFGNAQSKKNDDGSLTVTLTADEATVESLYKDVVTAIVYNVCGEDLTQVTTKNGTIVVTVADGYVKEYKVSFVSEITAGSDKVTYDSANSVTFISCGKDITVTAPANLDNYYEMDQY
ncbi:MAG: hypothetical protein IKD04_02150 [Clostridia bacterium]|nr:hypothetical protein [Clostridia bacterium]